MFRNAYRILLSRPHQASRVRLSVTCSLLVCVFLGLCPSPTWGQVHDPWPHRHENWYGYNPRTAYSSYIHAQADLMRAQGERAVDFAEARVLLADAVDKELDNWLEHMQRYWQRKIEYEKNRIKLNQVRQIAKDQRLNDQRAMRSRMWERIKNNPQLNANSIVNGNALNFLLDRLANTVGTYDIARLEGTTSPDDCADLQLTPEQLRSLQLSQTGVQGGKLLFRADGSSKIDLEWWPFKLRDEVFQAERQAYMAARRAVLEQAGTGGQIDSESLLQLKTAYGALSRSFYERYVAQEQAQAGWDTFRQFHAARAFLHALGSEIHRYENTGDARLLQVVSGFHPETAGQDVLALLAYMNRNGVRFAPAQPGDEYAYHAVFRMMRDIYVTVADNDQAIQPRDLTDQLD